MSHEVLYLQQNHKSMSLPYTLVERQVIGFSKVGNICSKPRMPSDNILKAFWLVEINSLLILSKGFHLVIGRILGQTEVGKKRQFGG